MGSELTRGLGEHLLVQNDVQIALHILITSVMEVLNAICFGHFFYTSHLDLCLTTGTGGNPELGEQAAQESLDALSSSVGNADMVGL